MRSFFLLAFMFIACFSFGQSNDPILNARLSAYVEANRRLDFEAIMNYIHPKLFKVASKEAMIESLKQTFNNDRMQIKLDSMYITQVGPAFAYGPAAYRKVDYSMTMDIRFTDTARLHDTLFVKAMEKSFANVFRGTAVYHSATETFHVMGRQFMMAVKDKGQLWMFIGYKPDKKLNRFLFPEAVITKFNLLQE